MKIITSPSVFLLARQTVDQPELDRFLAGHGVTWESDSEIAAEAITETAGRMCYMSYAKPRPGGNKAYLGHILETGHGSVTEHAVWTFLITGVSRSLTHELVRHRAGFAYSQLSQRYVDESVAEYVVPPDLLDEYNAAIEFINRCHNDPSLWIYKDDDFEEIFKLACNSFPDSSPGLYKSEEEHSMIVAGLSWMDSMRNATESYCFLSDYLTEKAKRRGLVKTEARKFARQAARSVLPNATETKITVTANARALRHFLEQRGSRQAEPEIRKLANTMLDILVKESPSLFGDYQRNPLPDGTFEITTPHPKV